MGCCSSKAMRGTPSASDKHRWLFLLLPLPSLYPSFFSLASSIIHQCASVSSQLQTYPPLLDYTDWRTRVWTLILGLSRGTKDLHQPFLRSHGASTEMHFISRQAAMVAGLLSSLLKRETQEEGKKEGYYFPVRLRVYF